MQIITFNNIAKYSFPDECQIVMNQTNIVTPNFIINDLNINTAILYSSVLDVPADFVGNKYTYVSGVWLLSGLL